MNFFFNMKTSIRLFLFLTVAVAFVRAEGPFTNRDNKNAAKDSAEGTYPIPYQLPTVAEVTESLARIRNYLDGAAPTRVIDSATGKEITDFSTPARKNGSTFARNSRCFFV